MVMKHNETGEEELGAQTPLGPTSEAFGEGNQQNKIFEE